METDAKFSLCKHKHFWKVRGKELFSVIFYKIQQPATLAQHSGKIYYASERFFSNVIIFSSHTALNPPSTRRVQAPVHSVVPHYTTSYLMAYFWAHLYACQSGFLSPRELAGILRSDSSCPWTLDTLLPMKSRQRNHVDRQSWKFHFYLSRLACFFFFLLSAQKDDKLREI